MTHDANGNVEELQGGGQSTSFDFHHRLFTIAGACFRLDKDKRTPLFHFRLGDLDAAFAFPTIKAEFGLDQGSHDGRLLETVAQGLRYIKEIRPGDSIPTELLNGSASWTVEDRHRELAKARLMVQIASWMSGSEMVIFDADKLAMIAEDPATKERVQTAFGELAEKLGIGRENQQQIVDKIEQLARELTYIEALRERFGELLGIQKKLGHLVSLYRRDRAMSEEIIRVQTLYRRPLTDFLEIFAEVDKHTGEILTVLRNLPGQIQYVRRVRDDIHFRLMDWDEVIAVWNEQKAERDDQVEAAIRMLYRYVAGRYGTQDQWRARSARA